MEFSGAQIVPFWETADRPRFRAVVRFDDVAHGPVSYEFVGDDAGEAGRWTTVAIQAVQRGMLPPGSPPVVRA